MSTTNKETQLKAIFFDAAGTLFHLPRGVGKFGALEVVRKKGIEVDVDFPKIALRRVA